MNERAILAALKDLAISLGMTVRRAPSSGRTGEHPGGACVKLGDSKIVFLDPTASVVDQIDVLLETLKGCRELEERYLPPEIRELLDGRP